MAFLATSFGITSCRPDFDLDKRLPEWLGTSIYETLQDGFKNDSTDEFYTFNTYVRLIDDLGQTNILKKTGSKTLFVASDKAFDEFFKNCPFKGVTKYEDLSLAQKRMILNGSMLNNVYQVAMLSSSPGGEQNPPLVGNCMRRVSAAQTFDSIPVVLPDEMPKNSFWNYERTKNSGIVLLQDGTNKPLVFFVHKFMQMHGFDNEDYDFLFRLGDYSRPGNYKKPHVPADASVNGVTIEMRNKKCYNGFLHVMSEVIYLLPNMAEELASNPNTRIYSSIIERWAVPGYVSSERTGRDINIRSRIKEGTVSAAVAAAMDASGDSVYVKKYLSDRSTVVNNKAGAFTNNLRGNRFNQLVKAAARLQFDPGWNSLIAPSMNDASVALQEDLAVMFVPYDSILADWWNNPKEIGYRLRTRYGKPEWLDRDLSIDEIITDMERVPLDVIVELVNNNMQNSLVATIPSKFETVLNDAQDQFFENMSRSEAEATISDVAMCCNGAIYFTNKVYVPTAYKSVAYPVLVNSKLKIINWAVRDPTLAYKAYLNSMVAEYSFFVPLVDTIPGSPFENKFVWIDPASFYLKKYGASDPISHIKALAFGYENVGGAETVTATVYDFDEETGALTPTGYTINVNESSTDAVQSKFIRNRLLDLMDYHIVIGEVEADTVPKHNGYSYFRTKGGGYVKFKDVADPVHDYANMEVAGGWQLENEGKPFDVQRPVKIIERVDMNRNTSKTLGNGRTYLIDRPLLPARKSVYDVLSDTVTYKEFRSFFELMLAAEIFSGTSNRNQIASEKSVSTFSTYHYTVYVPRNAGIDTLLKHHLLIMPKTLNNIDNQFRTYRTALTRKYPRSYPNRDSVIIADLADSLYNTAKEYFKITDTLELKEIIASGGANPTKPLTDPKRQQLINFVKYHIQDNSVLLGASFNAGVDPYTGEKVDKAEYETAYMKGTQFVKVKVKGGDNIQITDRANLPGGTPNTRNVLTINTPTGEPYYNIICREYEVKPYDKSHELNDENYSTDFYIEASSNAVIHLIDEPLCNGDFNF